MARAMKRGMLEVQFNWIFILIAGAVILAFFFTIVQKQRSISDEKLALALINQFDAVTTGASVAKGSAQRIDLPRAGIDFGCSDECTCAFSIGDISRDYRDKIIFSPKHIEGKDVVFWTLDWSIPFRANNFLYVTNDRIKYFFVYDGQNPSSAQLKGIIQQQLPDKINAEFIEPDKLCTGSPECVKNENYQQVKFVLLDVTPPAGGNLGDLDSSFTSTDVTGLHIDAGASQVTFIKCPRKVISSCPTEQLSYVGDAGLLAAVFAYDATMYRCNMQEAVRRLSYVSQVMKGRTNVLANDPSLTDRGCGYTTNNLDALASTAAAQMNVLDNLASLGPIADQLSQENDRLLRQSCPTVY